MGDNETLCLDHNDKRGPIVTFEMAKFAATATTLRQSSSCPAAWPRSYPYRHCFRELFEWIVSALLRIT